MSQQLIFFLNQSLQYIRAENYRSAELILKQCLKLSRKNPEVLRLMGVVEAKKHNYEVALQHFQGASKLAPKNGVIFSNLGNVFEALERFDEALVCQEKAIAMAPNYAEAYSNMGNALNGLKRYEEALACHEKAIALAPNYAEAYSNMGIVFHALKRYGEGLACFEKAISLAPSYVKSYSNMGYIFCSLKRFDEALAYHEKAIALAPDDIKLLRDKADALYELKRFDEAEALFDRLLKLKPDSDWLLGVSQHLRMRLCSWNAFRENVEKLSNKIFAHEKVIHPFFLLSLIDDPSLHKQCVEIWVKEGYAPNPVLGDIPRRSKQEKIRLGYFSADFREHPVSFLMAELFELHDKNRFETIAFSFSPNDGGPMRRRLSDTFDQFIDVLNMSDEEIARLARELSIDIAIDLGGFTADNRAGIFSCRAAPVQVNYLGYPGTLGTDYIDYIIADRTVIPEDGRQFYSEKIAYLPNVYLVDDSKRVASTTVLSRSEFGLPENAFVFCCLNNDYKFNEQTLRSWSKILLEVKNGVLWVPENNKYFMANFINECERHGINANRVIFSQRVPSMADHLAKYSIADLFLDTFPYNAHTTAVDALKVGLPVLTLMGQSFASRVAASLLKAVQLPELIAFTREEYEAIAIELGANPKILAAIKQKLADNLSTTPLFNTALFASHLENAYTQMYERYHEDLPLDHIYVQD
jgi:predicted O-linked N-acetylglucosamine transferase (SPINDLY family)